MDIHKLVHKIVTSAFSYPQKTFEPGETRINTCVNPYSYHIVRRNNELFESMDGIFVDGMIMCWFINLLWRTRIPRLSFDMSGMAADLFSYLNTCSDKSIYFIGSKQDIIETTIQHFHRNYPKMNIIGYRNGYFKDKYTRQKSIESIINLGSDYTIIGMGSPLQEEFAVDLRNAGYKGIVFTCGGFLHQSSRGLYYYPDWINKYNLRAVYRLFHEKGLWHRLYNVLLEFPVLFTWDSLVTKYRHHKTLFHQ